MADVVQRIVEPFLRECDRLLGRGYSAVLHGSVVRGEYLEGWSDVNLLLVLEGVTPERAGGAAPCRSALGQVAPAAAAAPLAYGVASGGRRLPRRDYRHPQRVPRAPRRRSDRRGDRAAGRPSRGARAGPARPPAAPPAGATWPWPAIRAPWPAWRATPRRRWSCCSGRPRPRGSPAAAGTSRRRRPPRVSSPGSPRRR